MSPTRFFSQLSGRFSYAEKNAKAVEESWTDDGVEEAWQHFSSANLQVGTVEDSGFLAPLQILSMKRPDIATSLVELSSDGLIATFHFSRKNMHPVNESFNEKVNNCLLVPPPTSFRFSLSFFPCTTG